MVYIKFTFFLLATLTNIYFWRQRGVQDRIHEEFKSQLDREPLVNTEGQDAGADCQETSNSISEIYDEIVMKTPSIGWVDSQEFDRYRSKYLVIPMKSMASSL